MRGISDNSYGVPRSDLERIMNHYGVNEDEAWSMLENYSADELLPPRGSGITGLSNPQLFGIALVSVIAFMAIAGTVLPKIIK